MSQSTDTDTKTSNSAHHDARIANTSLLEWFRADDRPTIVFGRDEGNHAPETDAPPTQWNFQYSNPAFHTFMSSVRQLTASTDTDYAAFMRNIELAVNDRFDFAGHIWRVRYFLDEWRVIFCDDELHEIFAKSSSADVPSDFKPLSTAKENLSPQRHGSSESVARTTSSGSSDKTPRLRPRPLSSQPSDPEFVQVREYMDWTNYDIPNISPFVKMFRDFDWASTALGPIKDWPIGLKQVVVKMMANPDPRVIIWGESYIILYNEAVLPIIGKKHPYALGRPAATGFAELWAPVESMARMAYVEGRTPPKVNKMELQIRRREDLVFEEEVFFDFCMIPILGEDGKAAGVMDEFNEVTNETIAERRLKTIIKIGEGSASAENLQDVFKLTLKSMDENTHDVPFALMYSVKNADGEELSSRSSETASQVNSMAFSVDKYCWLEGVVGIDESLPAVHKSFLLNEGEEGFAVACREAWKQRKPVLLEGPTMPKGLVQVIAGRTPYVRAVVCAIQAVNSNISGFLVLGLNARRPFNDAYRDYIRLLVDRINTSVAQVVLPKEQREAQAAIEESALRHASLTKQLLLRATEAERGEANFMRIARGAPFGMFVLRPDGSPAYVNDSFRELTGTTEVDLEEAFAHDNFFALTILPADIDHVKECWAKMERERQPVIFEYRGLKTWTAIDKGTNAEITGPYWIRAMAYPEVDTSDDTIIGIQGWLENISLAKYTEQMQARRLEEALEHKRQSEAFIDMTSHEIRNPLSAIVLSADSIINVFKENRTRNPTTLSTDELEETVNAAQTIILCANHQRKLCSDILTLSKLDANLLNISFDNVDPIALVEKVLRMYAQELQSAEIESNLVIDESMQSLQVDEVALDPSRLLQVLINLLTNAIKFTKDRPRRAITISISASVEKPSSEKHGVAYIKPRDTIRDRPAINSEYEGLPEVYLQFAVQDTGRGLSESEMVVLFKRFSQASPKTYGQYGGSGLGLFISRELTELQGGQIGVSSMFGQGSTFAFYISTLKLPPNPKSPTTPYFNVPSVPGSPIKERAEPIMPAIVAHLLPGPTNTPALPIRTSSAPPQTMSTLSTSAVDTQPQAMHVLVVEDNIINQKIMAQQLRRQACIVSVASHGLEALNFLKTTRFARDPEPDPEKPEAEPKALSLILLDLEMPVMDGLTCIRHIREMERDGQLLGHVPVIAVTANARSEQIANALGCGMDLVVTKPFRIPDLLSQMKSLVSGSQGAEREHAVKRPPSLM